MIKKTKEQINKDFEELLAMSETGSIGIPTSEFSLMMNTIEAQAEALQQVRELHSNKLKRYLNGGPATITICRNCGYTYPCPTIKALDVEQ